MLVVASCAPGTASGGRGSGAIRVVAAENFWGSIAGQLGGSKVQVTNIIDNPNADPHDYEPTTKDGRAIAEARLVLINGIGYDTWASKLVAANPADDRNVITVGDAVGVKPGGNPHRWYSPGNVRTVIDTITASYKEIDPTDARYFTRRRVTFLNSTLREYHRLIHTIRAKYGGTPVGASESIFAPLAAALGLRLLTPYSFLQAISEGTEPTAADKATIDRQISRREISVYAYNSQNATPDVQRQVVEAKKAQIPVTTITETMEPAGASFQAWQVRELRGLTAALAKAGRR